MFVAGIFEHLYLGALEGDRPRDRRILKLAVKIHDELYRRFVVNIPQGGEGASGSCLDRHAREAQRGPVVPGGGVAGAQSQQLQRIVTESEYPYHLTQA